MRTCITASLRRRSVGNESFFLRQTERAQPKGIPTTGTHPRRGGISTAPPFSKTHFSQGKEAGGMEHHALLDGVGVELFGYLKAELEMAGISAAFAP